MRSKLTLFVLLFSVATTHAEDSIGLVSIGDSWRYFKGYSEPSSPVTAWRQLGFDDSSWTPARSGFGYGGLEPATELTDMMGNYISVFTRREFVIDDPSQIEWLVLRADYDDGLVAYLNGVEVWRKGFSFGLDPVPFSTASTAHAGGNAEEFDISYAIGNLVAGTNVLAIQAHNDTISSPGFRIVPELLANFVRGPFLQNLKSDRVTIVWRTPVATDATIAYGTSPTLDQSMTNPSLATQHVMTVTGLTPGTSYYYRVIGSNGADSASSPIARFTIPASSEKLCVAVMGDSGFAHVGQYEIAEQLEDAEIDLLLHVGDIVYPTFTHGEADLKLFSVYRDLLRRVPFYSAMGNHEVLQYSTGGSCVQDESDYLEALYLPTNSVTGSEHYYSFDYGDVHFVALSTDFRFHAYNPGSAQHTWLSNDLSASSKPWKILFFHHAPHTSSIHRNDDYASYDSSCTWTGNGTPDKEEISTAFDVLASQLGAQLMFFGHEHNFEKFNPVLGVHSMIVGGGGASLRDLVKPDPSSAQFIKSHQFTRITIDGDSLTADTIDNNGQVIDQLFLQRAMPATGCWTSTWWSPLVESGQGPLDGNHTGQSYDFIGEPIPTISGDFSNLGRVRVNNDSTNLYIGFEQSLLYSNNNFFLFIDVPTMTGVGNMDGIGNGSYDPGGEAVDGLDMLKNLSFSDFSPDVGCILGDEYGDGQFRVFDRAANLFTIGQGVFRLNSTLDDITGFRLQQYNRSPDGTDVDYEQDANFIELCIPYSSLGNLNPTGVLIRIAAVAAGDGLNSGPQERYLDRAYLGDSFSGGGFSASVVDGLCVRLQAAGDDQDNDGLTNEEELSAGTRPDNGDTDNDSLLDGWEFNHGLNPLSSTGDDGADGDPDGDGLKNWQESVAGTHPNDALSIFRADSALSGSSNFVVFWDSISDRLYNVHRGPTVTGTWSIIAPDLPSTPPMNVYTDSTGDAENYYQIHVTKP